MFHVEPLFDRLDCPTPLEAGWPSDGDQDIGLSGDIAEISKRIRAPR
jgi:hypothetical protein